MSRVSSSLQDRYPIFVSHISSDNDFSGARLAVELAFEHVNANSNLLSGYTLNATNYSETAVSLITHMHACTGIRTMDLTALARMIFNFPTVNAIVYMYMYATPRSP